MSVRVRKAIFPVGGLGTRFLPATKSMPKEMLPVVDKPLIQYAVEEAQAAGIEEFIFVTGRGKSAIENHFDRSTELEALLAEKAKGDTLKELLGSNPAPGQVSYTRQMDPLGLGHAVWCARYLVGDEPFAVLLADDLIKADISCLKQMVDAHAEVGGNMIALMDELYPTFRWFLYDARDRYSVPITVFGPLRATIYIGQMYMVFNSTEHIRALTAHFDELIRAAKVQPPDVPSVVRRLLDEIDDTEAKRG